MTETKQNMGTKDQEEPGAYLQQETGVWETAFYGLQFRWMLSLLMHLTQPFTTSGLNPQEHCYELRHTVAKTEK